MAYPVALNIEIADPEFKEERTLPDLSREQERRGKSRINAELKRVGLTGAVRVRFVRRLHCLTTGQSVTGQ